MSKPLTAENVEAEYSEAKLSGVKGLTGRTPKDWLGKLRKLQQAGALPKEWAYIAGHGSDSAGVMAALERAFEAHAQQERARGAATGRKVMATMPPEEFPNRGASLRDRAIRLRLERDREVEDLVAKYLSKRKLPTECIPPAVSVARWNRPEILPGSSDERSFVKRIRAARKDGKPLAT